MQQRGTERFENTKLKHKVTQADSLFFFFLNIGLAADQRTDEREIRGIRKTSEEASRIMGKTWQRNCPVNWAEVMRLRTSCEGRIYRTY